jgi:hypothetical protein
MITQRNKIIALLKNSGVIIAGKTWGFESKVNMVRQIR